jgi:hypothetical protein
LYDKNVKLDVYQKIFQSMHKVSWKEIEFVNRRVRNTILNEFPCYIHFNGGSFQTVERKDITEVVVERLLRSNHTSLNLNDYNQIITSTCFPEPQLESQIFKEEIITSDKYLEAFPSNYFKTDCITTNSTIRWRNNIIANPPPKNAKVIISGHSDLGITDKEVDFYNPKFWFTINKQSDKIFGLPLGITNHTNESYLHTIYGNLDSMIQVMNEPKQDKNLVYMNFNIHTYPQERQKVFDLFQNKEWVTKGNIENTLEGRTRFLRELRNHTFALCPRGGGVDTHRLWETLYMGSIPIVKRDLALTDFEDLPICFIDDWNEVTSEFLEKEKQRINSGNWNMQKLKVSYWIKKIALTIKD